MAVKKRKVKPLGILIILFLLASVFLISVGGSFVYLGSPVDKNDKENIEIELANSNLIIICNISISTIRLTSLLEANHICLFSFPIQSSLLYFLTKINYF